MTMMDRLKSMVGVGGADIELRDVTTPARAGGELRGTVVVRGGQYDQAMQDVMVYLHEERMVFGAPFKGKFEFWREAAALVVPMNGRVLHKGEVFTLPFALAVPPALEPSDTHVQYRLVVSTEVPGFNPKHDVVVPLVA